MTSENPATEYARLQTVQAVVRCVQSMVLPMDTCPSIYSEYWDIVNADGSFTDEELTSIGITAAELGNLVTVIENYTKFMENNSPAAVNYKSIINQARRLSA